MKVLGISGRERQAAAALAIDGAIVAAASEDSFVHVPRIGYRHTGGYPLRAIAACLARGGVTLAQVDQIIVADNVHTDDMDPPIGSDESMGHAYLGDGIDVLRRELQGRPRVTITPERADARQLASVHRADLITLVLSSDSQSAAVFRQHGSELSPMHVPAGMDQWLSAMQRMAQVLGLGSRSSYAAIDRLGAVAGADRGGDTEAIMQAISWHPERGVIVNDNLFVDVEASLRQAGGRLTQKSQALAAGFSARMRQMAVVVGADLMARSGMSTLGLAGDLFASPSLSAAMFRAFGERVVLAPVPEAAGRAVGAACSSESNGSLKSLALGLDFSEPEIKIALENCRLDYLYEPDWSRLLGRISRMLAHGSVVAWFQGASGFGPRTVGTRAILADPSNRYARENINRFLRHGAIDDPLQLSMTRSAMHECLDSASGTPFLGMDAAVKAPWRDKLRAALDHHHVAQVQMVTSEQSPLFFNLLELHRERTGVPGLISTTLGGVDEPAACTPRDAIRAMYSSAIDAFVIGRFLLMKDHWLLRSGPS
ncbi:MAG: carbamoyltransferase C-terminal domain-containing protein [Vicinamibacterales bacterium]